MNQSVFSAELLSVVTISRLLDRVTELLERSVKLTKFRKQRSFKALCPSVLVKVFKHLMFILRTQVDDNRKASRPILEGMQCSTLI